VEAAVSAQLEHPLDAFMRDARTISFAAADHGTWRLYERLKGMLEARCPALDSREYEWATQKLARMAGV
jgi:hypothetical protein